jgi:hypothetical protein
MNRRQLLQSAIAAVPVVGAVGEELTIQDGDELIAFKVTVDKPISSEARINIRDAIKAGFAGTKWENTPCFVLDRGADFQVVKRSDAERPCDACGKCSHCNEERERLMKQWTELLNKGRMDDDEIRAIEARNPVV